MTKFLTAATLLCSVAICIRLLTYRPMPRANHRHGIAWCAWLLTTATGGRRTGVLVGTSENEKKLQATYDNADEARQQAEAKFKRLDRGTAQLSYTLALGRADIYPETVTVSGFEPEIDGTDWLVSKVTHTIDGSSGFTASLELERGG
ncbi:TPA: phage holin family protein [Stenotrophomonas maltophilia]|nr:phage holin family protein [Stenotrophomonas maltophilia]